VPAGTTRHITFDAVLAVDTSFKGVRALSQNSFYIGYAKATGLIATTPVASTYFIPFNMGIGSPKTIEIP
jgi:hypothetical protein